MTFREIAFAVAKEEARRRGHEMPEAKIEAMFSDSDKDNPLGCRVSYMELTPKESEFVRIHFLRLIQGLEPAPEFVTFCANLDNKRASEN